MITSHFLSIFRSIIVLSIITLFVGCGGGGGAGQTPGAEETNANLSSIQISSGTLTFEPDKNFYSVEVDSNVASLALSGTVANEKASFVINGNKVDSGEPFEITLTTGQNTIQIVVTADDGKTTKTYTVFVSRLAGKSNNPDLSGLNGTQWKLIGWTLSSLSPTEFKITAKFANGQISGNSGVNNYGGPYKPGPSDAFSVGPLASTEMAGTEMAMRAEGAYMTLLGQAKSYKIADGKLTLYDKGRNESLIFEAASK